MPLFLIPITMQEHDFKPFFEKWYRPAMASASRLLRQHNDIEDIVLDAFTATWKNLYKLALPADAARFLLFVLKRKCIDQNKSVNRRNEVHIYDMHTEEEDYNLIEISALLTVDLIKKFKAFVYSHCTIRQKEIIYHFMLGKNNIEIGTALGVNHRTVSSIKLHVFDNFKKWLRNEDNV